MIQEDRKFTLVMEADLTPQALFNQVANLVETLDGVHDKESFLLTHCTLNTTNFTLVFARSERDVT